MANFQTDTVSSKGKDSPKSSDQVGHYSPNTVPVNIYKHANMIKQINMSKHANPENDLEVINFF
jgi:hypothetical protein